MKKQAAVCGLLCKPAVSPAVWTEQAEERGIKGGMDMLIIKDVLLIANARSGPTKAAVVVGSDGRILSILDRCPSDCADAEVVDAAGMIGIPGLVNAHTHSYANMTKALSENYPLEEMMFHIRAQGAYQTPEAVYYNTLAGAIEMLKCGITSCLDQLSQSAEGLEAALQAYADVGIRACVVPMITDRTYYQTLPVFQHLYPRSEQTAKAAAAADLIDMNLALIREWNGRDGRISVGFGPSGPQRSSEELLRGCIRGALDYGTVFHTHVLETAIQRNTAHLFYGKSMVQYLDDIGCLTPQTSFAHGVWLTEDDAKLSRDRGVTIAHCPVCNMFLGSGVAPVNTYRKLGWLPALGTDGSNGGGNQNLLETMKVAAVLHKVSEPDYRSWISAREVFEMATERGARLLLQDSRIGVIEEGKDCDMVLLDPKKSFALRPAQDLISQIVYGEGGAAVDTVFVKGRMVVRHGKCTLVDEEPALAKMEAIAGVLAEKIRGDLPQIEAEIAYLDSVLPRLG